MTDVDPQAPPTPRSRLRPITQTELTELISGAMPYAVISLALLAILYTFYFATDLFLPIFIALFLSTILRPLVRHLCRIGLPASLAAALVLTVVIGTSVSATVNLSQPATEWVNRLPSLEREIRSKLWQVTESIEQAKQATEKIQKIAEVEDGKPPKSEVVVKGPSLLDKAFASTWLTFVQILIVIPLTFFFLSQDSTQTRRAISRSANRNPLSSNQRPDLSQPRYRHGNSALSAEHAEPGIVGRTGCPARLHSLCRADDCFLLHFNCITRDI